MNSSFKDARGREWSLALDIAIVRKIRDQFKIDFLDSELVKVFETIFSNTLLQCDLMFVIAMHNCDPGNRISDEEFGRALSGDCIEQGGVALLRAVENFTPNPASRARVGKLISTILEEMDRISKIADQQTDRVLADIRNQISGAMSSSSQELPELSPGDTPSEN